MDNIDRRRAPIGPDQHGGKGERELPMQIMRGLVVGGWLLGCFLPACAADDPDVEALTGESVEPTESACQGSCTGNGQFDFRARGTGMTAWNGRRVVAAAIENDIGTSPTTSTRVVLRAGAIAHGQFTLECRRSLHENFGYPSWAAYVDVNGDGRCSSGDVGYAVQLFGWKWSIDDELDPSYLRPVGSLPGPIGRPVTSFCSGYFE
jgi:hypothetical protein